MKSMAHVTNEMLIEEIGSSMPGLFDSLDLIEHIHHKHPVEYAREVTAKLHTKDPVLQAHSDIASRLNFPPLATYVERAGSRLHRNCRGGWSRVALWRKRCLDEDMRA